MTTGATIFDTAMGWWYWFGAWIALALSIVLIWWAFLDAYRAGKRTGHMVQRMTWPLISVFGLVLQLPAVMLALTGDSSSGFANPLAILGLCSLLFVCIAMVAFFSRSSSTGDTIFSRTRQSDSVDTNTIGDTTDGSDVAVRIPGERRGRGRAHTIRARSEGPTPLPNEGSVEASPSATAHTNAPTILPASAAAPRTNATATVLEEPGEGISDSQSTLDAATISEVDTSENMISEQPTATTAKTNHEAGFTRAYDADTDVTPTGEMSRSKVSVDETAATICEDIEGSSTTAQLQLLNDNNRLITLHPRTGSFIVGRDSHQCSLAVSDSKTSRRHFTIDETDENGSWILTNLSSSNGTFVNGNRVQGKTLLSSGDIIEFGRNRAQFIITTTDSNSSEEIAEN